MRHNPLVEEEKTDVTAEAESRTAVAEDDLSDEETSAFFSFEDEGQTPLSLKEQMENSSEDFRLLLDMEYEKELGDSYLSLSC